MRILFIHKCGFGKASAADAFYIPLTLAKLGHEISIVVRSNIIVEDIQKQGVQVIYVNPQENWYISLRHIVANICPDIVHVFIHLGCGFYPFWLEVASKPIFILDIRSPLLHRGLLKHSIRLKNQLEVMGFDVITAHGIKSAHTVIGKRHSVQWLPPGVDFDLLPDTVYKSFQQQTDTFKLVYIGNLDKKRRVIDLIKAVLIVSTKIRLTLDIYGSGNDEAEIKRLIETKKITNIRLLGLIPRDKLFAKLAYYHVGVAYVPSALYEMAPPLKTIEYLACGLPVLATDTIGNRMFIQPEENGLLAGDDPVSFAQGIVQIASVSWLSTARLNARASVERFDWKRIISQQLLPVYFDVLEKRGDY